MSDDSKGTQFSHTLQAGEYVFREGDPGSEMFIIQEGQVEILKDIGGQEIRVALLDEGDFFGEMSILEDLPRVASARAVGTCVLLSIDSTTFDQMARHNPEIPVRMLRKLSRRLRDANVVNIEATPSSMTIVPTASVPGLEAARREALAAPVLPPPEPAPEPQIAQAPQDREPEPPPARVALLIHEASGAELPLSEDAETHLGRPDAATGFVPHVDLKPIDT
ncbi:MAG: Crp/Fnr family transcriptional regulator, partial [Acidobacteriota bacterium]